jgi:hypothetical protein
MKHGEARSRIVMTFIASWIGVSAIRAEAQEIYPPLDNPKLHFENDGVPDPRPVGLPGPYSPWRVAQWAKSEALNPEDLRRRQNVGQDPTFGLPIVSDSTSDGESTVSVYRNGHELVYELESHDGIWQPGGSSNLFLTASPLTNNATFDARINYDFDAKLSRVQIRSNRSGALSNGQVLAHVFTGFTLNARDSQNVWQYNLFLQVGHAASRQEKSGFFSCQINESKKNITFGYGANLEEGLSLRFASDKGRLHHLHFVLNDYLCNILSSVPHCRDEHGRQVSMPFPASIRDLHNWKLGGIYLGLETHNRDVRPGAVDHRAMGEVAVAFQIANLQVVRMPEVPAQCH